MAKRSAKKVDVQSVNMNMSGDKSVSVRKIQNGFIVSESGYTGKGKNQKWFSREMFSKTNPVKVNIPSTIGRFTKK